jgi:hypothetical protein
LHIGGRSSTEPSTFAKIGVNKNFRLHDLYAAKMRDLQEMLISTHDDPALAGYSAGDKLIIVGVLSDWIW